VESHLQLLRSDLSCDIKASDALDSLTNAQRFQQSKKIATTTTRQPNFPRPPHTVKMVRTILSVLYISEMEDIWANQWATTAIWDGRILEGEIATTMDEAGGDASASV
jgi:hypothetical protein